MWRATKPVCHGLENLARVSAAVLRGWVCWWTWSTLQEHFCFLPAFSSVPFSWLLWGVSEAASCSALMFRKKEKKKWMQSAKPLTSTCAYQISWQASKWFLGPNFKFQSYKYLQVLHMSCFTWVPPLLAWTIGVTCWQKQACGHPQVISWCFFFVCLIFRRIKAKFCVLFVNQHLDSWI